MANGSAFSPHGYQAQDRQLTTGKRGWELPNRLASGPTSCSRRRAAKLAAAQIIIRQGCVRILESTFRDQKSTTQRPPTGHVKPSRIPCLRASSKDHRSTPVGWNICWISVHVLDAGLDLPRNRFGANLPGACAMCSSNQPCGASLCRNTVFPSSNELQSMAFIGNRTAPKTHSGRCLLVMALRSLSTSSGVRISPMWLA